MNKEIDEIMLKCALEAMWHILSEHEREVVYKDIYNKYFGEDND